MKIQVFARYCEKFTSRMFSRRMVRVAVSVALFGSLLFCFVSKAASYTLSAPSTAAAGSNLTVSWTAPAGSSYYDMIGLYPIGTIGSSGSVWVGYTTGAPSGSFTLTAPAAGSYEFRYYINYAVYELAQISNPVTITVPRNYTLSAPSTAAAGSNLTVSWTAPAGSSYYDMIGLYPIGTTGSGGAVWSGYTAGAGAGSFTLAAPGAGNYEFRYFMNNAVYELAQTSNSVNVTSVSAPQTYTLGVSPSSSIPGANLAVSWTAPAGSSYYDMIGLYQIGTTGSGGAVWSSYTAGAARGSFSLTAPAVGNYEFRYFINHAIYELALTSVPVTVASSAGDFFAGNSSTTRNHKLLEWGWDSKTPQYVKSNIASMEQMPFDGTNIKFQYGHGWTGGTDYFGWNVFTSTALTINDPVLQSDISTVKSTPFRKFTDNFLDVETSSVHESNFVDWFEDWSTYLNNVTVAAQVAQQAGLKGIILDTEIYQFPQWQYDRQKYASTKTLAQYKAQVLQRGRDVMTAISSAYPDITVMLTFGTGVVALRQWYDGASFNESTYGYSLVVPFVDGMLQVISERMNPGQNYPRLIEGFESSYDFKTDSLFMTQGYDQIRTGGRKLSSVPDLYDQFYRVGFGTWMRYDWFSPADFNLAIGYSLNDTESYAWVWSDGATGSQPDWWTAPASSIPQAYIDALTDAKSRYLGQ